VFHRVGRVTIGNLCIRKGKGVFWKQRLLCCGHPDTQGYAQVDSEGGSTETVGGDTAQTDAAQTGASGITVPGAQDGQGKLTDIQKMALLKKRAALLENNKGFVQCRDIVLVMLFLLYVGTALGLPLSQAQTASYEHGFFWETHMIFLGVFSLTKLVELILYALDPTLDGELDLLSFGFMFFCSFLGYSDGYQDATSIVIAYSCPNSFGKSLGWWMGLEYALGVILLQWIIVAILALRDPSRGCLLKVLHMDALASCITLPEDQRGTWQFIHMARTFGEDLPQGVLQSLFVLKVKRNYFLMLSIFGGICSSGKAVYDACHRLAEAAGAETQLEGFERKEGTPLPGTSEWTEVRDEILAACGKLPDSPDLDRLKSALQDPRYSHRIDEYRDEHGSTALMFCVGPINKDTLPMVEELVIKHNANPQARGQTGYTPVAFAKAWHNKALQENGTDPEGEAVLKLLMEYGGNADDPPVF